MTRTETTAPEVMLTAADLTRQSLARGPVALALLHVERARTGAGSWYEADPYILRVLAPPIDATEHASLYYGAPALTFLLNAAADRHRRYRAASKVLDEHVLRLTRRRLAAAAARIKRGRPATFGEYDLFHGLTGLGALFLRHHPDSDELAEILRYLVTLTTRPRREDGIELPGWWVAHHPDELLPTPGGHANLGMAHGAAGLLALLALATSRGCVVDGQREAITTLTSWFDRWQQDGPDGPWWPQWITRDDLHTGHPAQPGPGRPSWCYGTPGIARAQQLAGIATEDQRRKQAAENALAACLADAQLDKITEPGLCHGIAGVYQTAFRAARDANNPAIATGLPVLAARLAAHTNEPVSQHEPGLLTGAAGIGLALDTMRAGEPPRTGWDTCLLIT